MEETRTVRFVGDETFDEYHGADQGVEPPKAIDLLPGDVATVTAMKAEQLEEDMPHLFEFDADPETSGTLDPTTQLKRLKIDQLIEIGKDLDIDTDTLVAWTKPGTKKDTVIAKLADAAGDTDELLARDDVRAMLGLEAAPA